jgi:molybdopterin-guanine dinucleotide biosynthesis protein
MAIVVIGGHSRSVGKTSVVAGLIAALREREWTAIKLTQYGHGICSRDGQPCDCAVEDQEHSYAFTEEAERSGETDTSRFLLAGAQRALWVRTRQGNLAEAMPRLRRELARAANVILESNSVIRFLQPDLYLVVLDPANPDFKPSAREFLDRADAAILDEPPAGALEMAPLWEGVSLQPIAGRPVFRVRPPQYVTPEIVAFVRERLQVTPTTETRRHREGFGI